MGETSHSPRLAISTKIKVLVPLSLAVSALTVGVLALGAMRAEHSPVSRGEGLVLSSGCYACHASSEQENRVNFRSSSSGKYRSRGLPTFWENGIDRAAIIKEWIRDGVPAGEREKHERLLVQMPAYGEGHLAEEEIESITAWILAKGLSLSGGMGNADLDVPDVVSGELSRDELLVYGDRLARQQACYQCHGELGQGGVANPASFKGYIPGFFGDDYNELTEGGDPGEVLHWIEHGRGLAVESGLKGKLARFYFEGQATGMPGYGSLLSENEKALLVDYLRLLNEMGPLGSGDLETFNQLISKYVLLETTSSTE